MNARGGGNLSRGATVTGKLLYAAVRSRVLFRAAAGCGVVRIRVAGTLVGRGGSSSASDRDARRQARKCGGEPVKDHTQKRQPAGYASPGFHSMKTARLISSRATLTVYALLLATSPSLVHFQCLHYKDGGLQGTVSVGCARSSAVPIQTAGQPTGTKFQLDDPAV